MDILTTVMLGITAFFLFFGVLFGLKRGALRSVVRLIMLGVGILFAWVARKAYVAAVMSIDLGGGESLNSMLDELASEMGALADLVGALIESFLSIILFIVAVIVMKFVTAVLFFFVGFFLPKSSKRGLGALVGLVQGALIAFCICAPLNGLLCNCSQIVGALSRPIAGETILSADVLDDLKDAGVDFEGYQDSTISKIYTAVGGKFYDTLASAKTKDGKTVSLSGTVEVVDAGIKFAGAMESISKIDMSNGLTTESREELRSTFKELDAIKGDMSAEAKETINAMISTLVSEATGGEEIPPELSEQLENLDFSEISFETEGNLVLDFVDYADKGKESEVTVTDLVNGLAESTVVLPMLEDMVKTEGNEVDLSDEEKAEVTNAINNLTDADKKETLRKLFGLN